MIVKKKDGTKPSDRFGKAGFEAEEQMAYKLRVAFEHADDVFVFNDIRIVHRGFAAQIDHLVLHRYGFFLIESKSVSSQIEVNEKLEFVRIYNGKRQGMDSPINQVRQQAKTLSELLNDNKEQLRRKVFFGLSQAHFGEDRFEPLVAISGSGEIVRKGCDPPELMKADAIVDRIRERIARYESLTGVSGALRYAFSSSEECKELEKDNLAELTSQELAKIREFLSTNHQPLRLEKQAIPASNVQAGASEKPPLHGVADTSSSAVQTHFCRHCNSSNIKVVYGKYGYYFKCVDCDGNTKIDFTCRCGAKAKISKRKDRFSWKCVCGNDDLFFENPG